MSNVPDDWNRFYRACPICRRPTHASEHHYCACSEDLECKCDEPQWERVRGYLECVHCGELVRIR